MTDKKMEVVLLKIFSLLFGYILGHLFRVNAEELCEHFNHKK